MGFARDRNDRSANGAKALLGPNQPLKFACGENWFDRLVQRLGWGCCHAKIVAVRRAGVPDRPANSLRIVGPLHAPVVAFEPPNVLF